MQRKSYNLPERSRDLLDAIAEHYGHATHTSALTACIQHVYMTLKHEKEHTTKGDTDSVSSDDHIQN